MDNDTCNDNNQSLRGVSDFYFSPWPDFPFIDSYVVVPKYATPTTPESKNKIQINLNKKRKCSK